MCEICDMMDKYVKAQKDLAFRIGQHGHALVMGNTAEAETAQTSAVNASIRYSPYRSSCSPWLNDWSKARASRRSFVALGRTSDRTSASFARQDAWRTLAPAR